MDCGHNTVSVRGLTYLRYGMRRTASQRYKKVLHYSLAYAVEVAFALQNWWSLGFLRIQTTGGMFSYIIIGPFRLAHQACCFLCLDEIIFDNPITSPAITLFSWGGVAFRNRATLNIRVRVACLKNMLVAISMTLTLSQSSASTLDIEKTWAAVAILNSILALFKTLSHGLTAGTDRVCKSMHGRLEQRPKEKHILWL